jgi:hypothetical protein
MQILLCLTPSEKARYAGYWQMDEFTEGFDDWLLNINSREPANADSVEAQAYDRGQECAMRRMRRSATNWSACL